MVRIALALDAAPHVVWVIRTPTTEVVTAAGRAVGSAHANAVLILGAGVWIGASAIYDC